MLNLKAALGLAMIQAAVPVVPAISDDLSHALQLGIGGVVAILLFRRYEALSLDFRKIVTENTAAITRLGDLIDRDGRQTKA